jgi:hypothetical protein
MNRNIWATILATLAVVAVLILGFRELGGPKTQRLVRADLRRVRALAELAQQIDTKWRSSGAILPSNLKDFSDSTKQDPVTHKPFDYQPKQENKYALCATFDTNNRDIPNNESDAHWIHTKGDYCFEFDASQQVPPEPYYF